jgi:hypothetical protein
MTGEKAFRTVSRTKPNEMRKKSFLNLLHCIATAALGLSLLSNTMAQVIRHPDPRTKSTMYER